MTHEPDYHGPIQPRPANDGGCLGCFFLIVLASAAALFFIFVGFILGQ